MNNGINIADSLKRIREHRNTATQTTGVQTGNRPTGGEVNIADSFKRIRQKTTVNTEAPAAPTVDASREQYIYGSADLSNLTYKTAAEYDNAIADLQSQADAARSKTLTVAHPAATLHNKGFRPRETEEYERLMSRIDALKAEKVLFDRATGIQTKYGALADNADYDANKGVQRHDEDPIYKAVNKDTYGTTYPDNHEDHYGWVDGGWVTDDNADALAKKYGWDNREIANRIAAGVSGQQEESRNKGAVASENVYGELTWMTAEERDKYNYLYQTAGAEAAKEYLDDLKIILQRRNTAATEYDTKKNYDKAGKLGRALMNAGTLLTKPIGTAVAAINDAAETARGEYSPYGTAHYLQTVSDTVRGETAQDIYTGVAGRTESEGLAQLASTLYQGGMSAADAALGGLALGPGYLALAGADAATHKAKELYESGAQDWQILAGSVASGAIEALMEKVPLDELMDMAGGTSGVRAMVKNIIRQSGIEGTEEALTEIANLAADSILQGGNSDLAREVAAYEQAGYTPEQARQMAARDKATDVLWATVGGMAGGIGSSTAFSTVGLVKDHVEVSALGNQFLQGEGGVNIDTAIEIGLSNAKGTEARQMAEQIAQRVKNNQSVSAYQVGRMIQESQTAEARRARQIERAVLESAEQATVKPEVAETLSAAAVKLGQTVRFAPAEQFAEGQAGLYDPSTDTVLLNPKTDTTALLGQLLTHEMTHTAEGTRQLAALEKTVRRMMGETNWRAAQDETKTQYAERGIELTPEQITRETVAAWCAEHLFERGFAQMVVEGDASTGNAILQALDAVRRAVGIKNSPSAGDIASLERLYMKALENRTSAREGSAEYAIQEVPVIDLSKDSELARRVEGLRGSTKYKKIQEYILEVLGGQPIRLSDGKMATVDKSDALHIANKAAGRKTAEIAEIRKLIENAVLYAKDIYAEHNKFDSFYYYKADVRFENETYPSFINVGRSKNDGTYHIYDITKNIRDTADRINGLERPKPNEGYALQNGVSNTSVTDVTSGVNTQSMQNGKNYSKGAYLPPERMTGDALIDPSGERAETPSGVGDATSLGEGGYATPIDEAAVLETAMQGRKESQVRMQDEDVDTALEELARDLGEEELLRRMYNAAQIRRPTGTVEIDGRQVDANAYVDAYEQALPNDPAALQQTIKRLEQEQAETVLQMAREGTLEEHTFGSLKIDLQLFAARRKWDMLQLEPGEEGTETRQFYEKRLRGTDANHHQELVDLLAGRSETYNPIANEKTLERANGKLRSDKYKRRLMQRIGRYNPHDLFNTVDVAAAQVLINDALNDGEWQVAMDLITGLSRKGTELGRAVQAFSMMARLTPEGTLKAAQRTIKAEADYVIGEGADEGLDMLADDIAGALGRLARLKGIDGGTAADGERTGQGTVWDGTVGTGTPNMEGATRAQLVNALSEDLAATEGNYLSKEQIKASLQQVITNSTNVPEQVKRYVLKKIRKNDGALADRLYEVYKKGHLTATATRQALEEALELPTLTDGDVQTLVELATKAQGLAEDPVAQADAMDEIYDFLGAKMSVNRLDRLQAWRKFGMLANVKTHLRNIGSNAAYVGVRKADDLVAMVLERLFLKDPQKRTAQLGWSHTEHGRKILPELQKRAEEAVLEMQHRGAKYETGTGQLKTRRKFFGESKVGEALNSANRGNSDLLEREDVWFFKPAYIDALGQMMTARGVTEITDEMHAMAMKRALDATFRADNVISEVVSSLKRYQNGSKAGSRLFGQMVDVVIPFHKTPANIAIQTALHSPLGIAKGAFDLIQAARGKGGATTAQIINEFAKGITGTALLAIGLLLGSAGLFNTGFGKTEKERAADELAGRQENALMLGDVSVSLDWLQPAASPLIVGASMGQRLAEDDISLSSAFGAVMDGTDSLFEMTMLQSLYDILGGYDAGASATAASVVENVVSQSIPTVFGQAARAIDPVQRKTTGDSDFETLVNQVMAKIPGLTYLLDPELDVWGEEVYRTGKPTAGNAALNILQQVALPANIKTGTGKGDRVSREILRLYGKKGESKAIPTAITRDEARDNGLDYVRVNKQLGATNRQAVEDFVNDKWPYQVQVTGPTGKKTNVTKFYSEMTDDERRRVLSRIYTQNKKEVTEPEEEDDYFNAIFGRLNNGNS